jgi:hypothetical protein
MTREEYFALPEWSHNVGDPSWTEWGPLTLIWSEYQKAMGSKNLEGATFHRPQRIVTGVNAEETGFESVPWKEFAKAKGIAYIE